MEGGDFCMSSIDERVVQMKFDNAQFAKGVADTNQSLAQLKNGLNLDAQAASLNNLNAAGSRFSLAGMAASLQEVTSKFSALGIMGVTALVNITNQAVNAGLNFAKSFSVAPIMEGFSEYELKMGSIQTILANTAQHGTTLDNVKHSLEELNHYADKTIYNFGDMTRNIGYFTNAGIKLEDATAMIKGFSNEAASSGTNAMQAAGAAYQLSQALSKGKITLEDWRSLTNASMGSKNMQNGLIDIAKAMNTFSGKGTDATAVAKDFNGSLEKGWLTADVMSTYLRIQAGELSAEQMKNIGLSQKQIDAFIKQQKTAEEAATKVRTFTNLIGTLREGVGSSWAQTWELLVGDFNEATDLFTNVSNTLGGMIHHAGETRNNLIKDWVALGGRTAIIETLGSIFNSLVDVAKAIGSAFREIFPPVTAQSLFDLTNKFKAFFLNLKPGPETLELIKRTAKGVFAVFDIGWAIIQAVWGIFERLFKSMDGGGNSILQITARIGDFLVKVRDTVRNGEAFGTFFYKLGEYLRIPVKWITELVGKIPALMDKLPALMEKLKEFKPDFSGFQGAIENLKEGIAKLKPTGESIARIWDGLIAIFKRALEIGQTLAAKLGEAFKKLGGGMQEATEGVNFQTILGMLGVGALGGILIVVKRFFSNIMGVIEDFKDGDGILGTIKDAFGGITDVLGQMQATLKASTLLMIAAAIGILTISVVQLSRIDAEKLPAVLSAIAIMFAQLSAALAVMDKMNIMSSVGNMAAIGTAMILLAVAIKILASAMEDLSKLSWEEILKGLAGVTGLLIGLASAVRIMGPQVGNLAGTGIALLAIAGAIKILASACRDFSSLSWEEIARGLTGVGTVLGALAIFTRIAQVNKGAVAQAAGLVLLGVALKIMASAVLDFANMNPSTIQQGLGALTGVLFVLAGFTQIVKPAGMISTATAMVILGGALKIMATAVTDFGNIPWEILGRGLAGMAGALVAIGLAMHLMPKDIVSKSVGLVIVAAALKILADVLGQLGGMSVEEIGKSLITLAGSLLLIAVALNVMNGALAGAAALIIACGALLMLANVLKTLGGMSIEEIITGLATLAASLALLGVAALVLTPVIPALMGLGIAVGLLGAGAALAGIGMLAFATGLTLLAAAGGAATTVLIAAVAGLLGLLPFAFQQVGLALVALAQVLGDNVQTFVDLGVKLITGLLDGLRIVLPNVISFVLDMIFMLLDSIANNIQRFVDAGMRIIVGFIAGIAGQIGNVINAAVDLIVNFLNGIANNIGRITEAGANIIIAFIQGIGKQAGRLAEEGYNTIINFVNSLANTIRNNTERMNSAGANLASAIIDGMTSGIRNGIGKVAEAARNIASSALDTVKSWLGIKSPSREFRKIGEWSSEGMAIGITKYGGMVANAAKGVAKTALEKMQETMSRIGDGLDGNMELAPVITPVLDLTTFKKDATSMSGMITPPALELEGTYSRASAVVAAAKASQAEMTQGERDIEAERSSLTFIQNNYSPKAISPVETYRNTKNQISRAKGVLVK
jgi:tape measure domain-containing protein